MDNKDNVLEFRHKPPTPDELEAWSRFVKWASTAPFPEWEKLYGAQAKEFYDKFWKLFLEFIENQRRTTETKPVE